MPRPYCTIYTTCVDLTVTAAFMERLGLHRVSVDRFEGNGFAVFLDAVGSNDAGACQGVMLGVPVSDGFDELVTRLQSEGILGMWAQDDDGSPFASYVVEAPNGLKIALFGVTRRAETDALLATGCP